jgi:hypothetical protein
MRGQGRALFLFAILILFSCATVASTTAAHRRAVAVDLVAAWDATPLHLEAAYERPCPLLHYTHVIYYVRLI